MNTNTNFMHKSGPLFFSDQLCLTNGTTNCTCLCTRHTQTKTTQNTVRPRSSNKRSRNLLKFENKSRFPVHTTTKLSFHHVYHVRCRLLLRAGSNSKYGHHVFATSPIRSYNSHYDLSTFLSRQS